MDHLAIGTYEGFLIGYDIDTQPNDPKTTTGCTLRYAYAAHERSIRCIAGSFPILASASVDESIKVYQLDQLQELATLYDLQMESHKVARDKYLKLWKTNGDCVCSLELPDEAFIVKWTEDGQGWVIATQTSFSVHSLQTGLIQQWEYSTRLVCLCALTNDIFVVGGMDGHLRLYKVGENKPIQVHKVDGGSLVKGIGVGRDGCIYSLSSKGVLEARSMQGAYRWIEQLPTSYRPTAFHVIQ
ncbi:p21-activated protein kinase-interacting protein 1 [Galdieria sulphuraria]|nr:p21-activated protein kinase-interacting protein 1 [Galdieria sulphuraria]